MTGLVAPVLRTASTRACIRSEEHTSELQSRFDLVCRLLLEKKNNMLNEGLRDAHPPLDTADVAFQDHHLLADDLLHYPTLNALVTPNCAHSEHLRRPPYHVH